MCTVWGVPCDVFVVLSMLQSLHRRRRPTPRRRRRHLFYTRGKNDEFENRERRRGINGHHQSPGDGGFSPVGVHQRDDLYTAWTRVLVCYFICLRRSIHDTGHPPRRCPGTVVYTRILLLYGLNFRRPSGRALFFFLRRAQQQPRSHYLPSRTAPSRAHTRTRSRAYTHTHAHGIY